ncbi:hypothetical protein F2Q69_00044566 [Brassica cretica]|uniref:Uncharacterized protein n=1 Tax=Brassica cretica TaxID=69181 RepID=A0A8S9NG34_BRACR|nr:hypothetical protein F2Q69_00044566 [Brassica cretica]
MDDINASSTGQKSVRHGNEEACNNKVEITIGSRTSYGMSLVSRTAVCSVC